MPILLLIFGLVVRLVVRRQLFSEVINNCWALQNRITEKEGNQTRIRGQLGQGKFGNTSINEIQNS